MPDESVWTLKKYPGTHWSIQICYKLICEFKKRLENLNVNIINLFTKCAAHYSVKKIIKIFTQVLAIYWIFHPTVVRQRNNFCLHSKHFKR